ncbi:MAG: hypothetical protein AAGI17_05670 [Planctomycetota bacterium]
MTGLRPIAAMVGIAVLLGGCASAPREPSIASPARSVIVGSDIATEESWSLLTSLQIALINLGYTVEVNGGSLTATKPALVEEGKHRVRYADPERGARNPYAADLEIEFMPAGEFEYQEIELIARVDVEPRSDGSIRSVMHRLDTKPNGYLWHPEVGYGSSPAEGFWETYSTVLQTPPAASEPDAETQSTEAEG